MQAGFCGRCGSARAGEDDRFCRACGAQIDSAPGRAREYPGAGRRRATALLIAGVITGTVVTALVMTRIARRPGSKERPQELAAAAPVAAPAAEPLGALIKRVRPAVVTLEIYDARGKEIGFGSGFFINRNGEILTNHHVIEGASSVKARTADGATHPVQVVLADDKDADLAKLLAFVDRDAPYLKIAAQRPQVGDSVIVVGSPMGLEETITQGIVSAVPEQRDDQSDLVPATLQITAAISEGSSGGPVLNASGEVIGVATAFMRDGENLSFAVPLERILALGRHQPRTFAQWHLPRRTPDSNDLYVDGMASWRLQDCDTGLDYFKRALERDPAFAEAWWGRGLCLSDDGRAGDAIGAFDHAVRLKPDFAHAHYDLGVAYADQGRRDLATHEYVVLKTLSPELALRLQDYIAQDSTADLPAHPTTAAKRR